MPTCRPILAPFWEDTKYSSGDKISYLTSGTAPNRIFTLQWIDMIIGWDYSSPTPTPSMNMQLKIYETTNVIEFAYSQIPGGLVGSVGSDASGGASIGLSAVATGTNNFLSLSNSGSSPSASSVTEVSTIALRPVTDQLYRFTPTFVAPVTFANFKAVKNNAAVNLSWTTFTEINNKGFDIEKSLDGKTFSKIGFLPSLYANGISNTVLNYSFNDNKILAVNYYYRLKQIDIDGKFWYSPIALVKGLNVKGTQIGAMFPNPAKSNLSMLVQSIQSEKINLYITDLSGRNVKHQVKSIIAGDNLLSIDIAGLPPGIYLIKANGTTSGVVETKKFIKQ